MRLKMRDIAPNRESMGADAINRFFKEIDRLFLDKDAQERAFSDLKGLRQRGKPFKDYLTVFSRFISESSAVLNNRLLRSYLKDSLNNKLSREIVGTDKKEDFTNFL